MRAATGIQLLLDGFEGTEQRPAFRIKHDDIHHAAGVQRVGFDIVGRVIRGLVTLAPLRAAGLRDVVRRTAAHIHLNRIEGFTGHGVFALEHGRNGLHLFDLSNGQLFVTHVLQDDATAAVSRVRQILRSSSGRRRRVICGFTSCLGLTYPGVNSEVEPPRERITSPETIGETYSAMFTSPGICER